MKNNITQFSLILIAFVAVNLLMSFAKPIAADEPKQYILLTAPRLSNEKFEQSVNEKLTEGWRLQGGVAIAINGNYVQAMVK